MYPLLILLLAAFVAYPLLDLLGKALEVDGRLTLDRIAKQLADPYTRRILWNTLQLGATVALIGTVLATLYAYAMTRMAIPWKGFFHFLALLPTISPPILMALSLILLYGRRGMITNGVFGLQTTALYGYWGLVAAQVLSYLS